SRRIQRSRKPGAPRPHDDYLFHKLAPKVVSKNRVCKAQSGLSFAIPCGTQVQISASYRTYQHRPNMKPSFALSLPALISTGIIAAGASFASEPLEPKKTELPQTHTVKRGVLKSKAQVDAVLESLEMQP